MRTDAYAAAVASGIRAVRLRARIVAPALVLLLACLPALAQSPADGTHAAPAEGEGSGFGIDRWTVDGGGGRSSGGAFAVSGTIAQPDADPLQPSTGGVFAVTGGFWPGLARSDASVELFADGFENP